MNRYSETPHINWFILLSAALSVGVSWLLRVAAPSIGLNWQNIIHVIVITLLPFLLYCFLERHTIYAMNLHLPRRGTVIPVLLCAPGVWALSQLCGGLTDSLVSRYGFRTPEQVQAPASPGDVAVGFLAVVIVAPVMEELLYRGAVLHAMRRFGSVASVLAGALLFALAHYNPSVSAAALVFGIFNGYVVLTTGSVFSGMLLHGLCNAISYGFMLAGNITERNITPELWVYAIMLAPLPFMLFLLRSRRRNQRSDFLRGMAYLVFSLPFALLLGLYLVTIYSGVR